MRKKIQKWFLAFLGGVNIVGSILGVSIFYIINGEFNVGVILGSLTGALVLLLINAAVVFVKKPSR